ncbi:MAG: ABC transporter permease, partial [Candidatus Heimdallarchaeota archaeon]
MDYQNGRLIMSDAAIPPLEAQSDFQDFIKYTLKRTLRALFVILGIITIIFILFRIIPGDPVKQLVGKFPSAEREAIIRKLWGLDKPVWEQFLIFLGKLIFELDIGNSYDTSSPVMYELSIRFPATIELSLVSMLLATLVGIPIGILSAYKQHTRIDYISMVIALIGVSMPIYWLGLMLQGVFAQNLGWFIGTGRIDAALSSDLNLYPFHTNFYLIDSFVIGVMEGDWAYLVSTINHLILPATALATIPMAVIARMMRSSMIEEMRKDYVRTARSKGLRERIVIIKHVSKNALIPTITVIGLNLGALLAGAVLTETIFSWPGVGKYVWVSITQRDSPVIMGFVMVVAIIFVFANMITDIIYAYLDPRVRYYE